jgi:hypothetical protein
MTNVEEEKETKLAVEVTAAELMTVRRAALSNLRRLPVEEFVLTLSVSMVDTLRVFVPSVNPIPNRMFGVMVPDAEAPEMKRMSAAGEAPRLCVTVWFPVEVALMKLPT